MIAEELEHLIATGEFSDGARLSEVKLAERFGVSRTPIREAYQRLTSSGLVEQIPNRGVFVRHPGPKDLLEMFEMMAELEAACARFAARRISDAALEELEDANAACGRDIAAGDADSYYRDNERFHQIIYTQSGNGLMADEAHRLQRRLKPFRKVQLQLRGRMAQSLGEHEGIVAALRAGNADLAAERMRDHVAVQGENYHDLLSRLQHTAG